jgi:hypothetical protein
MIFILKVNYPDSNEGKYSCITTPATLYSWTFEWMNEDCEIRRPFVCEVPASAHPTTIEPPTLPTPKACHAESPEDGWVQFTIDDGGSGEDCFNFNAFDYKNWIDAKDECVRKGGRLASIHSEQENLFITRHLSMQSSYNIGWIGLQRDSLTGQFVWIDFGTNPDYLGWGEGGKSFYDSKMERSLST